MPSPGHSPSTRPDTDTGGASRAPGLARLRLIALSDLHMRLAPHDYATDRPTAGQSLLLAAGEAQRACDEAPNALIFDIGDAFEGSPIDEDLHDPRAGGPHPMAQALNALGIDAATLGNHDFNFGLDATARAVSGCAAPVVLANLVRDAGATPLDDTPFVPPIALLRRAVTCDDGLRRALCVGVVGVAPPQTIAWDRALLGEALVARDPVEAVAAWAPELRRRGADLVVVLCHSGIGSADAAPMMENAAVPIAALDTVDVVLAGHAHDRFPGPAFRVAPDACGSVDARAGTLHGKPAVMPGYFGNHIGLVDLALAPAAAVGDRDKTGWRIADRRASLRPVGSHIAEGAVAEVVARYHARAKAAVTRVVARSEERLHTYFAHLGSSAALDLVNAAQTDFVARRLAGSPAGDLPLLSAAAPLKAGGQHGATHYTDVPAGVLRLRHLVDLQPYQNTVAALCITGADLRAWLERTASVFNTVPRGARDAPLRDDAHPGYVFDVVSGVSYRIDLSVPPAFTPTGVRSPGRQRIVELRHAGRPVRDTDRFVLATSSYRVGAGGGYPVPDGASLPLGPPVSIRSVLADHLAQDARRPRDTRMQWSFLPQKATSALYRTGPGAAEVPLPDALTLCPLGAGPDGYLHFRVHLDETGTS